MYAIRSYYVHDLLPHDAQLHFREAITHAAVDAEASRGAAEREEAIMNVITSYSIHYTKLYDITGSSGAGTTSVMRTFYVEESYVLPWMYPYLTPHGLIMNVITSYSIHYTKLYEIHKSTDLRQPRGGTSDTCSQKPMRMQALAAG